MEDVLLRGSELSVDVFDAISAQGYLTTQEYVAFSQGQTKWYSMNYYPKFTLP